MSGSPKSQPAWLRLSLGVAALLASLPPATPTLAENTSGPLELVKTIAMPEVRGRIDHLDIDLAGERLFVAALGNNTVEIIDLRAGQDAGRLESLREPQGVGYVPKTGKLFVANGGGGVSVFSGTPLRATTTINGLDDADNVRLDGASASLYVGYGRALAVIDADTQAITARIALAGHPESFQLQPDDSRVFVNVPSAGQIAVVDRSKQEQVASWLLADAAANFPMALDATHHRLFVGTRRSPRLLAYDTETGNVVAAVSIGGDVDDLFYDAKRQRIYAICGVGVVNIIEQRNVNEYVSAGEIKSAPGARTGLFVGARDVLYVAVPARGGATAEIRAYTVR